MVITKLFALHANAIIFKSFTEKVLAFAGLKHFEG